MMSSVVNPTNGGNDPMPGDYESWSPSPQPRTPFPRLPPAAPPTTRASGRTPFPRLPPTAGLPMRRRPMVPTVHRVRSRRHRRRPLTPEIVIDRRHRSHSSWGGRRVITVPLDHRPTLGLRGPPKRVIEIERVRCRRRRKHRSVCYDYEYEYDDPPPTQQPFIVANPIANPSLPVAAQQPVIVPMTNTAAAATSTFLSNLTQEMVENLPRQTIHLPPIHIPGSQADANTELDTVIFPAEIINPVDGSLSIIQVDPTANHGIAANIQPTAMTSVQPQLIHIPTTVGVPMASRGLPISPATGADPLMQRFQELFQRLSIPQTQPVPTAQNPAVIRPTMPNITPASNRPVIRTAFPNMSSFNPANNTVTNPPIIPSINTANVGGYPSANIRPTNPLNMGSYRPANITPVIPENIPTYRPASIASSGPFTNMSYTPANITGYRPSNFTPSASTNNATYPPASIAPSNSSDIGPYQPANITPYININNRSTNNPLTSSGPTPYTSTPSAPSSSFTPFPRLYASSSNIDNNSLNPPTPNQSINSMPKSILRNTSSTAPTNTVYTRLNSPDVLSSNNTVRKTTTFT